MLDIRRAVLGDHERIAALWEESRLRTVDLAEWDTLITAPAAVVLVAEEEDALAGAIVASFDGWRAYIYHVAVIPGHRRRRVAQALFQAAHEYLAQHGERLVYVMVNAENEAGIALLRSMHYVSEGDIAMVHELSGGASAPA